MLRMRTNLTGLSPTNGNTANGGTENWEMRPSGMLVQKRLDSDQDTMPHPPTIRVRVKFGSIYHEIHIKSQATFGELKKMLSGPTGLHHEDQKVYYKGKEKDSKQFLDIVGVKGELKKMLSGPTGLHHEDQKVYYKGKEKDSKQFLDIVGVKDKSKLVLVEDPISQEKRYLELRKTAIMEKASKSISQISLEVDRLAGQVAALESVISKGGRVAEKQLGDVIEHLMNQLIKLDGILGDGDVKLQRKMQVRRVQKYVETLDMLKIKNSTSSSSGGQIDSQNEHKAQNEYAGNCHIPNHTLERALNWAKPPRAPKQQQISSISSGQSTIKPNSLEQQKPSRNSTTGTVVTTQWETFESAPPLIPISPTSSPKSNNPNQVKSPWDIFQ